MRSSAGGTPAPVSVTSFQEDVGLPVARPPATARRRRRPLLPSTVTVPTWLVSSAIFAPDGAEILAQDMKADDGRVRFWRGDARWRPSVAVLDLLLAIRRLESWSAMPEDWLMYSWRSLAIAMAPSLEGLPQGPALPGGFHEKYTAAIKEAEALKISVRQADGRWSPPEPLIVVRRKAWGGKSPAIKGERIWAIDLAPVIVAAISHRHPAGISVASYFSLRSQQLRLAFVLATASAAHANVTQQAPAVRTLKYFLPACGYSEGSWSFNAWGYRLCERIGESIRNLRLANGAKLHVEICTDAAVLKSGRRFVETIHLRFWAAAESGRVRNVSPTEAQMRTLVGNAAVDACLKQGDLDADEMRLLEQIYFQQGRRGDALAKDLGHWNLLAKLFGGMRGDFGHQLKLLLEEAGTARTADHDPELKPRDLVRVAVYRIRKRMFLCAELSRRSR